MRVALLTLLTRRFARGGDRWDARRRLRAVRRASQAAERAAPPVDAAPAASATGLDEPAAGDESILDPYPPLGVSPARAPVVARPAIRGERTLGYVTLSGAGMHAELEVRSQAERIHRVCRDLELSLLELVSDVERDGLSLGERPGLARLLDRLAAGEASCVVVSELRRLVRSRADWELLKGHIDTTRVRLVVIDIQLDTSERPEVWTRADAGGLPGLPF
jgi:hypothetical protein